MNQANRIEIELSKTAESVGVGGTFGVMENFIDSFHGKAIANIELLRKSAVMLVSDLREALGGMGGDWHTLTKEVKRLKEFETNHKGA